MRRKVEKRLLGHIGKRDAKCVGCVLDQRVDVVNRRFPVVPVGGVVDDSGYDVLVEVAIGIEGGLVRRLEVKVKVVTPVERVHLRQHRRRVRTCACSM